MTQQVIKPTIGNLVLWRSVYMTDTDIHVDAVRVAIFTGPRFYPGASVSRFDPQRDTPGLARDSVLYQDIQRFKWFSNDYIGLDPRNPRVIGDIRYALLPHSVEPLWGIVIDPGQPGQHARYGVFRGIDAASRRRFVDMVMGRE